MFLGYYFEDLQGYYKALGQILKCLGTNASLIKHMWFLDTSERGEKTDS